VNARVFFILLSIPSLAEASQSVAVMPFRDLSGQKPTVGDAIRETVTSDLKEISGLKVIERAQIDRILAEQKLQSKKDEFDPSTTARLGKLLGASLIVTGAYQRVNAHVRLTARFVKVETAEIVGTAKCDGNANDFFSLQDRVTSELLRSAGIEKKRVQKFAARARPRLRSIRAVEIYGDAVVEKDEEKKVVLLRLALKEDPNFIYASRDLDELERRMKTYQAISEKAQARANREAFEKLTGSIARETDPMKVYQSYATLFGNLITGRRPRALVTVAERVRDHPPPAPTATGLVPLDEMAQMYLCQAYQSLRDDDALLREGERFLSKYPTSMYFSTVQLLMNTAIDHRRAAEEGEKKAADEISKLAPNERADPCRTGNIYKTHGQLTLAREKLEACVKAGDDPKSPGQHLYQLAFVEMDLGHFAAMRANLERLSKANPDLYRGVRYLETTIPVEE
jgi:TolB-like protein/tetratricopeptide (TPR) repeat protein